MRVKALAGSVVAATTLLGGGTAAFASNPFLVRRRRWSTAIPLCVGVTRGGPLGQA
jgi:hypothetical protein